jgi:hypothetical protein
MEEVFLHTFRSALRSTKRPIQCVWVHSPGLKRLGSDVNHLTRSSAGVKERVELVSTSLCASTAGYLVKSTLALLK